MKRRQFIGLVGIAAAARPFKAHAQVAPRRVGCLVTGSPESHGHFVAAFRRSLENLGYAEERDLVLELRWSNGDNERLLALAEELAMHSPDLVVAATATAALAAMRAAPKTPIVCVNLIDPMRVGLIATLARPGGNVTGVILSFETLLGKQLELAREVIPGASKIGMLVNPMTSTSFQRGDAESFARALGVALIVAEVRSPEGLEAAFRTFALEHTRLVLVPLDSLFIVERQRIAAFAIAAQLPTVTGARVMVEGGGLISYGVDIGENWRRAAYFVDRILRGAKPADLPVELPTKYELLINLKTAAALRMELPPSLLASDVVRSNPDIIHAVSSTTVLALKHETSSIPM